MASGIGKSGHSVYSKPPRKSATLDHWMGPSSHLADGSSTDPGQRDPYDVARGRKETKAREPKNRTTG